MAIDGGYIKYKKYMKQENGNYKLTSYHTSSNTVHFDDGKTAEEKIQEMQEQIDTAGVELTQEEYDALPDEKLTDGITYYITDGDSSVDPVVEDSLEEIFTRLGGLSFVALTQAEYDALTTKEENTIYFTTE